VTDRDGMYVHVTAKGAMSFRMDCQPMSWLRSTMQPSRPSRNGHPISTAFRFRSGAKDPERNTLRNAVINWPDGDEGEKSHFRDERNPLSGVGDSTPKSAGTAPDETMCVTGVRVCAVTNCSLSSFRPPRR